MINKPLLLFYPSSYLPHKNHHLLLDNRLLSFLSENNIFIALTISEDTLYFRDYSSFYLLGNISRDNCLVYLNKCDALLFLSSYETLGLPLIEASLISKPIICPHESYTREILGETPYYYDSDSSISSLLSLLTSLIQLPLLRPSTLVKPVLNMQKSWLEFKLRLAL